MVFFDGAKRQQRLWVSQKLPPIQATLMNKRLQSRKHDETLSIAVKSTLPDTISPPVRTELCDACHSSKPTSDR
jgi:hypothetical protein